MTTIRFANNSIFTVIRDINFILITGRIRHCTIHIINNNI